MYFNLSKGGVDTLEFDFYKKLASLEVENERLRSQLNEIKEDSSDKQIDEIFERAKKKLFTWMGSVIVVLTLFDFIWVYIDKPND